MPAMRLLSGATLAAAVAIAAPDTARADQLGYEFGGGPVLASHGTLASSFAPEVAAWFGLVGYHGPWAADVSLLALDTLTEGSADTRAAIGGTAGLRHYLRLAGGVRNGVVWRLSAFGGGGLTVAALRSVPADLSARTTAPQSTVVAEPVSTSTLVGPRFGAGLELTLAMGKICSHVALDVTDQELWSSSTSGGYAYAELSIALAFGH